MSMDVRVRRSRTGSSGSGTGLPGGPHPPADATSAGEGASRSPEAASAVLDRPVGAGTAQEAAREAAGHGSGAAADGAAVGTIPAPSVAGRSIAGQSVAPAVAAPPVAAPLRSRRRIRIGGHPGYESLKRALDVVAALAVIIAAGPMLIALACAILVDSRGPIYYRARRVGRDGRPIHVIKFRTMHLDADRRLHAILADPDRAEEFRRYFKLRRDPRITRFGGFLRRTSLDELPQVFNVLRGEMSLVGPRPIVEDELTLYEQVQGGVEAYLAVKPGITGLWQISGRNDTSYRERIELDRRYVARRGLLLDLRIIARTPAAVLSGNGAY